MIHVSSSQFGAVCGVGHYSRAKLYRMISFGETLDVTYDMLRGRRLEPLAVASVEAELGICFEKTGERQESRAVQCGDICLSSTPDGVRGRCGLETKVPRRLSDELPVKYLPQLAGQMLIHDFEKVYYAELGYELRLWVVYPSEALERAVVDALELFCSFVRSGTAPPRFSSKANPKPTLPVPNHQRLL